MTSAITPEFTDISLAGPFREESLLQGDTSGNKLSGKAWGRVKNLVTRRSNYPRSVFLILGNEFCERFNYYGMRTILVIYLTEWHGVAHHSAVALFHIFSMVAYFSPLLGAVIADGYLGRFKTILYISILYAIGTLIVALTAFPPPEIYGPVIGLLIVGLGTGGIKPCVSAFGGDQFSSHQEKERTSFFSAFYFMINLGSMIATFLTPILRADVHCIEDSCYPLAFGISTILMILATIIFACGNRYYKHIPPTGNLFGRVVKCIWHGLKSRIKHGKRKESESHWLDYSKDSYEDTFVEDVKALLKVLWLFLPLPLFWALFDQQGSRWTLQAVEMNGNVGSFRVKPDQLQTLNPLLILLLIPLFERLIYPCLSKLRIPNRPLQRMCSGMALCSAAFVIAGFIQIKLDSVKENPLDGESGITFINTVNCSLDIKSEFYSESLPAFTASPLIRTSEGSKTATFHCKETENTSTVSSPFLLKNSQAYRIVVHTSSEKKLSVLQYPDKREKDSDGKATLSIVSYLSLPYNTTLQLRHYKNNEAQVQGALKISLSHNGASNFTTVEPGSYQVFVPSQDSSLPNQTCLAAVPVLTFGVGSVQTVVLQYKDDNGVLSDQITTQQFVSLKENDVSMAWMIPQYFVITSGEILFSITGLAFAYSQAPASMKSLLQAAWLLCVAFGDLIVVIVAEAQFLPSQTAEFFMFAILMGVDTVIFGIMAYQYKSRTVLADTEQEVDTTTLVPGNGATSDDIHLEETQSGKQD